MGFVKRKLTQYQLHLKALFILSLAVLPHKILSMRDIFLMIQISEKFVCGFNYKASSAFTVA